MWGPGNTIEGDIERRADAKKLTVSSAFDQHWGWNPSEVPWKAEWKQWKHARCAGRDKPRRQASQNTESGLVLQVPELMQAASAPGLRTPAVTTQRQATLELVRIFYWRSAAPVPDKTAFGISITRQIRQHHRPRETIPNPKAEP
jgi:hypothetical protein